MPDPDPTAGIFPKLVRTHKHEVFLFNEYCAVNPACKKVISQLIPEKYYKSLSSQIIGFAKFTSLQSLTHNITKYAELEDNDIQKNDQKIKGTIKGGTIFEEFIKKIECNQEAVGVQNPYTPASNSIHWNQAQVGLFAQNRHIVNAKLCAQGFA